MNSFTPPPLYATNVAHYDHVLSAMNTVFGVPKLMRRWEPSPLFLNRLVKVGLPERVGQVAARRVRDPAQIPHDAYDLGRIQLLQPLAAHMGLSLPGSVFRHVTSKLATNVEQRSVDGQIFQFVEGLGHKALESREFQLSICERRAMHHAVYEGDFDVVGDFPFEPKTDRIGDLLDFEYEQSHVVLVYSEAARRSFLSRGFLPSKIRVSPIGMPPQLGRLDMARNPHRIAFVGRGDVYKGLDLAVATIEALGHPYELHIAGTVPRNVQRWLRGKSQIVYRGLLDRERLRDLYSSSSAMLLPSTEAFGFAVAEAAHHGLHTYCLPDTGITEFLPAASYTHVSGRDPRAWAEKIRGKYHLDYGRAESANALSHITWAQASSRLAEVYRTLAN